MRRYPAVLSSLLATTTAVTLLMTSPAAAESTERAEPVGPRAAGAADRINNPDAVLSDGWRESSDRAVTTSGDATGLHVLVADRADAYRWRTVATLVEPMLDADQWIGQSCVTDAGSHAMVVYAPRTFTNHPMLMEAGAFAAIVNLDSGEVTKLDQRVTLAYYNPGCGTDGNAVLSRLENPQQADVPAKTWIATIDVAAGKVEAQVRAIGQITSAVPVGKRILAVKGRSLVEVEDDGALRLVARTGGAPLRLMPEGHDGGLAFQIARGDDVDLARLAEGGGVVQVIETAPLGTVKLRQGARGDVYAVGLKASHRVPGRLPDYWRTANLPPDSQPSTDGELMVIRATTGREATAQMVATPATGQPIPVEIATALLDSAQPAAHDFTVPPATELPGGRPSPVLGGPTGADDRRRSVNGGTPDGPSVLVDDYSDVPWDPDRACAVPRNDPHVQAYQPSRNQVEWAANLAVRGALTDPRPASWLNSGLPSYSPQGMFPSKPLSGGGYVPAQILLGILAQESNLYQASWRIVDGLAGNPLTSSGFYGIHWDNPDPYLINWDDVDCGYGVAQVTTGMHTDDTGQTVNGVVMNYTKQKAVAQDYAVNIAAGLRILQDKWNQTRNAGLIANNGDPSRLENWWFALWAYNTGFYPDDGGPWGVGWSNNPASPYYPEDRQMFLTAPLDVPEEGIDDEVGYDNAQHPNHWSYPERVIGFAYHSLIRWDYRLQEYVTTYEPAVMDDQTTAAQPDRLTFCTVVANECDPLSDRHDPGDYPDYPFTHCMRDDLRCWWHTPVSWVASDCADCGVENRIYGPGSLEPPMEDPIYSSDCTGADLPPDAMVIDNLDSADPLGPHGCSRTWGEHGTLELEFGSIDGSSGRLYPSKVDVHQINGGFGGHFWMAHVWDSAVDSAMRVTGTWQLNNVINGPAVVWAHVPDHGARTHRARYQVRHRDGVATVELQQEGLGNRWLKLGVFQFQNQPWVRLSNMNEQAGGTVSMAYDAVAFRPLPVSCHGESCDGLDPHLSACDEAATSTIGEPLWATEWEDDAPNAILSLALRESSTCDSRWARISVDAWCLVSPPCLTTWPSYEYLVERIELINSEWVTTSQERTMIHSGTVGVYWTSMVPDGLVGDRHRACYRGNAESVEDWALGDVYGEWVCTPWYA